MGRSWVIVCVHLCIVGCARMGLAEDANSTSLELTIVDDATSAPVPARVYVTGSDGRPYLPVAEAGQSIAHYDVTRGPREVYACVGGHSFSINVPAGTTTVTVERGKEYPPLTRAFTLDAGETRQAQLRLLRVFDLAAMGWYSGDLHVHTPLDKLPIFQQAEDLNVAFPITAWTTSDAKPPRGPDGKVPERGRLVNVDDTHVYWSLNSEYELFSVEGLEGEMGAVLLLGHNEPFTQTAPPIGAICAEARRQNAIIDWDKHAWPWSMMLLPVCGVDTMELSNNHMWRLPPKFLTWGEPAPEWMNVQPTARGWADYGFQTWYALLNAGIELRPSAGSANGVHPVPLGFSRVYVKIDGAFTYDKWVRGLKAGRSFVTNGPAIFLNVENHQPGDRVDLEPGRDRKVTATVVARSARSLGEIELIMNGEVVGAFDVHRAEGGTSPHFRRFRTSVTLSGTSWLAARCYEDAPGGNVRIAHTAPIFFTDADRPPVPRQRDVAWLIHRVETQLERVRGKVADEAVAEYRQALEYYRNLMPDND